MKTAQIPAILVALLMSLAWVVHAADDNTAKGLIALREGRISLAVDYLQKAVRDDPKSFKAYMGLGSAYLSGGDYEQAAKNLEKAVSLSPTNTSAAANLASAYNMLGADDKAIAIYQKVVAQEPNNPEFHSNLASVYQSAGQLDQALAEYDKAIELRPSDPEYLVNKGRVYQTMNKSERAIELFKQALSIDNKSVSALTALGVAYRIQSQYDKAESHLLGAIKQSAHAWEAQGELGVLCEVQGKLDQAIYRYSAALKINPQALNYLEALASVYLKKGEFETAIAYYQQVVTQNPQSAKAHGQLGIALYKSKDYYGAVKELRVAVDVDSGNMSYLNALGGAYRSLGKNEQAQSCFQNVLLRDSENTDARVQLGIIAFENRNWPTAEKYLKGALAISPGDPEARYYVGMIEVNKGNLDAAIKQFGELKSLVMNDARVYYGLGLAYSRKKGEARRAIDAFTAAVGIDEKHSEARWELAKLLESTGDKELAYKEYKKILINDPSFRLKTEIMAKLKRFRDEGIAQNDDWQNF